MFLFAFLAIEHEYLVVYNVLYMLSLEWFGIGFPGEVVKMQECQFI